MAVRAGEDVVATLYADVHYYYGPPANNPPHHRFDKRSYVYLFENAAQKRARLEIANSAGTPDQDAVNGFLDNARIEYSHKHSCLVSLTVDGNGHRQSHDVREWQLPAYDLQNESKYLYRLHTLDIYFWAREDAILFINEARRILAPKQVTLLDEPQATPSHSEARSSVVEKLEKVAISDPPSQNKDPRRTASSEENPPDYTPLGYNPAAPAAPEAIRHRVKTPPPPEDGNANPLSAAAMSDEGQAFVSGPQNLGPIPGGYFPGPPRGVASASAYGQNPYYQAQVANQLGSSEFQAPLQSPSFGGPEPSSAFSNYHYGPATPMPPTNDYSVHQQIYRPTEGEVMMKVKSQKEPRGKLEQMEKGVSGFLKKLDKKYP